MIRNMPAYVGDYAFIVVREVNGEMWFYGAYNDRVRANSVARDIGGSVIAMA